MIRIEATVAPQSLPAVKDVLEELGGSGMTVTAVRSNLINATDWSHYRGVVNRRDGWLPAAFRVEIVLPADRAEDALARLADAIAHSPHPEGRILAMPMVGVTRIRTGETSEAAVAW